MPEPDEDFDLQILRERDGGGRYRVNVIQSPAGEADGEFSLPFSEVELNETFRGLGQVRKATRGAASPEIANAREFGAKLFDRVFAGDVRDCLYNSRGRTQAAGHGLRIRLRLTKVPELLDLPWELLFDRGHNRFVALDDMTVVRHLPVAEPVIPMRVEAPLRVLVAVSNPRGDLDSEEEQTRLSNALDGLSRRGLVELAPLQPATFDGLEAKLREGTFHVLHFVGHGAYDPITQSGFLSFDERRVSGMRLADLLRPFRALRLVVLNACEGGRTSREDAFAGVAQSLVQSAIPAVVAMQFPVTDTAAIVFAGAFYTGIAEGRPVDLAVAAARRAVNLKGEDGDIEWATPVLYMRGSGALFDVGELTTSQVKKPTKKELPTSRPKRPVPGKDLQHVGELLKTPVVGKAVGTVKLTWAPIAKAGAWKPGSPIPKLVLSTERFRLLLDGDHISDLDLSKGAQLTLVSGPHTLQMRGWPSSPDGPLSSEYLPSDVVPFELKDGVTAAFTFESVDAPPGRRRCVLKHA